MKTASRPLHWLLTWLLVGVLLAAAFAAVVFHRPLTRAAGLDVVGAPTTVDPSLFSPPPAPSTSPALGVGTLGPAPAVTGGRLPARKALEAKLALLDTRALRADPKLPVTTAYEVVDVSSGDVLAASNAEKPLIPASNTKLLTIAAVTAAFGGSERFPTRVLQPAPGKVVLVGGGDPLLTSVPVAADQYPRAASLQELAAATARQLLAAGHKSVTLGYDATYFTGPGWAPTWPGNYRDQVTTLSALWADEGRDLNQVRSRDPALLAASTFASQLTAAGVVVTGAPTVQPPRGRELARVESPPVHVVAEVAMQRSNNSFTEALGRHLARKLGRPASFDGAVAAIREQLTALGLWHKGAVLHDASGLSRSNLVPTAMLAGIARHVGSDPRLAAVLDGLPVAGVTGTLAERFDDDVSRPARGIAKAKTGTLSLVSTLSGTTVTRDGRVVAYAFMTNGSPDGWAAKVWADQGVGTLTACGC